MSRLPILCWNVWQTVDISAKIMCFWTTAAAKGGWIFLCLTRQGAGQLELSMMSGYLQRQSPSGGNYFEQGSWNTQAETTVYVLGNAHIKQHPEQTAKCNSFQYHIMNHNFFLLDPGKNIKSNNSKNKFQQV